MSYRRITSRFSRVFSIALPALFAIGCAEGDVVVREADNAERLAEYEQVAEASTREAGELPREVVGEGPDYERRAYNTTVLDRYEVPNDTPSYRTPKVEQVGATECPETMHLTAASYEEPLDDNYAQWLLDEDADRVQLSDGTVYRLAMPGIDRGYKPQSMDSIVLLRGQTFGELDRVTLSPSSVSEPLGEALMGLTPCATMTLKLADLAEDDREELGFDGDDIGVTHIQLLKVKRP